MVLSVRAADHRTIALVDALAAFWVAFWLVVAGLTGYEVWRLSRLSDTAQVSAQAADRAGQALQQLSEIPLLGPEPGELGDEVRRAAAQVRESAARTRGDVQRLAVLLGVAVFLIPSSPVLGCYLPLRLRRRREVAALRGHLGGTGPDPALEAYLAHRALANLPYPRLLEVSAEPAGDVARGRHAALAAAELDRLGLMPP
jgi:hypothetical protein